jgi:hypothetical protein
MPGNIGDFKELIENSRKTGLFVDKSLFIQSIIDSQTDPLLITRPRRWGKTINMNMLFYFFVHAKQLKGMGKSAEFIKQCNDLFTDLNIFTKNADAKLAKTYMRQYPTIFISFAGSVDDSSNADITKPDWNKIKGLIIGRIAELFAEFNYLAENLNKIVKRKFNQEFSKNLAEYKHKTNIENLSDLERLKIYEETKQKQLTYPEQQELEKFNRIIAENPKNDAELSGSINFLTKLLCRFHKKSVYIFIDEYDSLINKYFNQQEILDELTTTFSGIFSAFAKPTGMINDYIQKVVFTGILRVAKANIFSSLNNLKEYTVLDPKFSEYYGFTEEEVAGLLVKAKITTDSQIIKNWYNGYTIGQHIIYNPWSIMRCIDNNGSLEAYWAETANPAIVRALLVERSSTDYKIKIRDLIKTNQAELKFELEKKVSFDDLNNNQEILWSVLVHTGYLTLVQCGDQQHIRLPNEEIKRVLKKYVDNWFTAIPVLSKAANSLLTGDILNFKEAVTAMLKNPAYNARIFSGGGRAANAEETIDLKEFMYQFLIMTELRCINIDPKSTDYEVMCEPNNVSFGKTRPDFLVINHKLKLSVVGELKVSDKQQEDLDKLAENEAIPQIERNQYGKKYEDMGYQLIKVGIAFKGSKFGFAYKFN